MYAVVLDITVWLRIRVCTAEFCRGQGLLLYASSQREFAYSLSCGANVVLIRGLGKNVDCGVIDRRKS